MGNKIISKYLSILDGCGDKNNMSYLDIIFIIIIVFFIFNGLRRGLVRVIGGIIGLFVGIYLAGLLYPEMSAWLQSLLGFSNDIIGNIIGFLVVFIVANRLFAIVIWLLDRIVNLPLIGTVNRLLGGIFGLIEGLLIVSVIVAVLTNFGVFDKKPELISNSKIIPYTNSFYKVIRPILPKDLKSIPDYLFKPPKGDESELNVKSVDEMSLDELIDYLNAEGRVQKSIIEQIKENALKEKGDNVAEYIKNKFKEYLDTLDSI